MTTDGGTMERDTLRRLDALATYVRGCLQGKPHPDDATAFPATVCEGDWRTLRDAIECLRSVEAIAVEQAKQWAALTEAMSIEFADEPESIPGRNAGECAVALIRRLRSGRAAEGAPIAWMSEVDWGDGRGWIRPRRFHDGQEEADAEWRKATATMTGARGRSIAVVTVEPLGTPPAPSAPEPAPVEERPSVEERGSLHRKSPQGAPVGSAMPSAGGPPVEEREALTWLARAMRDRCAQAEGFSSFATSDWSDARVDDLVDEAIARLRTPSPESPADLDERCTCKRPELICPVHGAPVPESPAEGGRAAWRPIETAPKDGTPVLLLIAETGVLGDRHDGHCFVGKHPGLAPDGFDMGWSLYPGYGGVKDKWIVGWMPLPAAPSTGDEPETDAP